MKILVTGAEGFIGSNLVPELRNRDHEVWVSDIHQSGSDNYIRADVSKFRQLERIFEKHKFDLVYHLAAEYGRWNGEDYYENLWLTNVVGTKNLLRLQEAKKFRSVLFSSAEVYGDYEGEMREDVMDSVEIKQMNDYAMSKWVNEMQALNSSAMFGTEIVRVRPVNAYGPREYYSPYRGAIPIFIHHAMKGLPYTVYRGHHRIFDYIEDTCRTFANIADKFRPGEVYNVGGKNENDIKYVSDLILSYLGKDDSLVTYKDWEPFTTKSKKIDCSKAASHLGHNPRVSLEDGLRRTVEWWKKTYHYGQSHLKAVAETGHIAA
ncbi:MAG TPA: NAD(P)-dependent oxidoreductase [Candidatus Bathyarchaeia archaeon]|nr:NAD(P)-dependent oxidoreductase [Candidatus Bathyarchaeia archaeon]